MSSHLQIFHDPGLSHFMVQVIELFHRSVIKLLAISLSNFYLAFKSPLKRHALAIMGFNTLCNITEFFFLFLMLLE